MSLGEIDTLNLTFEKLQALFDESQGYYESFLDANNLYKAGKLSDKEFFQKLGDYTVAYSALEFLAIKTLMEMKKTLDKVASGASRGTQSPGLMHKTSTSLVSSLYLLPNCTTIFFPFTFAQADDHRIVK